jgi:hypothetical protein
MVAHATQRSSFNRRCIIGAPTPFWELITRISITTYFGWVGLSAAGKQVRWVLNQDFDKLATADSLDFIAETVDTFFTSQLRYLLSCGIGVSRP